MTDNEQQIVAEVLGFGSTMKILSNPYPLGGYSGFEIGLGTEAISLDSIARLGSVDGDEGEYTYNTLSIGKGLYYNIDFFLQFTPFVQADGLSTYASQLRWGFYESSSFPFSLSAILYGNGASFASLVNTNSFGLDLIANFNVGAVALYGGGGPIRATTSFIGGPNGITSDGNSHDVDLLKNHYVLGLNFQLNKFFLAMQVDRYVESTYGGKIGMRF